MSTVGFFSLLQLVAARSLLLATCRKQEGQIPFHSLIADIVLHLPRLVNHGQNMLRMGISLDIKPARWESLVLHVVYICMYVCRYVGVVRQKKYLNKTQLLPFLIIQKSAVLLFSLMMLPTFQ